MSVRSNHSLRPLQPQLALLSPQVPAAPSSSSAPTVRNHESPVPNAAPTASLTTRGSGILTGRVSAARPGDLPKPRYANFNSFLADMPNHDWLNQGTLVVLTRHGESVFNRLNQVFHGSMDSPLIDAGKEQARNLGRVLRALPIRAVYASTVSRARDTAEIIRGELGLKRAVIPDDGLIEVSHGILDSYPRDMNAAEVSTFLQRMEDVNERERLSAEYGITPQEADYAVARCRKRLELIRDYCAQNGISEDDAIREAKEGTQRLDYAAPIGGESFAQGYVRAGRFKAFLESTETAPGAIVVTAHGMFDKELLLHQMGIDLINRKQLNRIRQDNCCINVLWRKSGSDQWHLFVLNDVVGPQDSD